MRRRRTLVLGATGHIGAHVVRTLLAEGHEVRAAYRRTAFLSVLEGLSVERVRVDLDSQDGLRESLDGCEWVFHAAGYYPPFRTDRRVAVSRGMDTARRVLELIAAAHPARVVFTSSAATIRRVPDRAADERDAEPWPLQTWRPLYATVKVAMEQEAMRAAHGGLPIVIVNPTLCLGEYDARPFSGRSVLILARSRLPVYIDQTLHAVYTGDVGVGHVRAAERGRLGERYLLTARQLSLLELATMVAKATGSRAPRWRLPFSVAMAAAWGTEWLAWLTRTEPLLPHEVIRAARTGQRLDGSKAVRELGLPQTPIEEAVRRALTWFQAHGYCKGSAGGRQQTALSSQQGTRTKSFF